MEYTSLQLRWFSELGQLDAYNDWTVSQITPYLGNTVLEVGCGIGIFTERFAKIVEQVRAIDIDPNFVKEAVRRMAHLPNVTVTEGDVTKTEVGDQFDSVIMLDILEHIEDDVDVLTRLRSCLKSDGRLIIKVPAVSAIYNRMDAAAGHYRRYNRGTLHAALDQAGFQSLRIWGFNLIGVFGWWLNGSLLGRTIPSSNHFSNFNRLLPVLKFIERKLPPPIGLSLFAVATAK